MSEATPSALTVWGRPVWVGSGPAVFSLPAPEPGPEVVPQPGKQLAAAVGVARECFPTRLSDPEKAKTNTSRFQSLHPAHCLGSSPQPATGNGSVSGPLLSTLVFLETRDLQEIWVSQPRHYWHLGPDNSLSWDCPVNHKMLHPWRLCNRCQQHQLPLQLPDVFWERGEINPG